MIDMAKITIEEKDYILRFPLRNLAKAEKLIGKPLQDFFMVKEQNSLPKYTISELMVLFRVAMQSEYPKMTQDEIDDLLEKYLYSGQSMFEQGAKLYFILGKASGFFPKDLDI